jgi:hypothetical protein
MFKNQKYYVYFDEIQDKNREGGMEYGNYYDNYKFIVS